MTVIGAELIVRERGKLKMITVRTPRNIKRCKKGGTKNIFSQLKNSAVKMANRMANAENWKIK